jgi:hypothetical protein
VGGWGREGRVEVREMETVRAERERGEMRIFVISMMVGVRCE